DIAKISQESVSGTAVNNIGFWRFLINKINGSSIGNAVFHGSDEEGKRVVFVRKIEVGNSSFNGRGFRHFYLEAPEVFHKCRIGIISIGRIIIDKPSGQVSIQRNSQQM